MTLTRIPIPSPFYSSRGGATVKLIVLHTAEGATNIRDLGAWFQNPSANVSSHTGADDTPNTVGEYVQRTGKAWTAAAFNPQAVQIELCGFASWSASDWAGHQTMLANTAAWVAEEAAYFKIPVQRLTPAQAQGGSAGVCMHADLGQAGGGHTDCGSAFGAPGGPFDQVLAMATGQTPQPAPSPDNTTEEGNMICVDPVSGGTWCIASKEGSVYTIGNAPYLGATNNTQMNAKKYPCVGIDLRPNNDGYKIVLDWGTDGGNQRFREYNFPRNGSGKASGGTY